MKDRQGGPSSPQTQIPLLSAALHCVSMTVIVFLRSSFGITYFRPKSVFFACSWAFVLYSIYAFYEKEVWARNWLLCLYGLSAVALYLIHLSIAFAHQIGRNGEHDHYSGTPHVLRILRRLGKPVSPRFIRYWQILWEPLVLLVIAGTLRLFGQKSLSFWLACIAPCLAAKEALNSWFELRHRKRHKDAGEDAMEIFDEGPAAINAEPPKAARKERIKRTRPSAPSALDNLAEERFLQVLRLLPGFTMEQAEQNYRTLIKQFHPDPNQDSPENNARAAELNEAIEYFRKKTGL